MVLSESVKKLENELIKLRRELHMMPENSYEEYKTSGFIRSYIEKQKPDKLMSMAKTGVKAVFMAPAAKRTIAFRADMDALPVNEETKAEYESRNKGFMHACGHDGHMAILLGLAKIIGENRDKQKSNIVLLFQPAEETTGGAQAMIDEGALEDPKVDEIYGLHMWPDIKAGKIGIKEGVVMAMMCDIDIEISGRGAHGAKPHLGIDALVAAGHFIDMLQTVVSRGVDPYDQAVKMEGTIRTLNNSVFENTRSKIKGMLKGIEKAFGVETKYIETMNYAPVENDKELANSAAALVEKEDMEDAPPAMAAEDFSAFQQKIPGLFIFLGVADDCHKEPLHSSKFDFDDKILSCGVELYKRIAGL